MNEQKQKIISDICPFYKEYGTCEQCNKALDIDGEPCYWECMADAIINNNYVKQSEGEWIEERYIDEKRSDFKCSVCEFDDTFYRNLIHRFYKYCPNCGAKMKGGAEE